jgi:hypothetical protein|tara:strand:+ start:462 stop:704 length:243 start_codon:yes stop_codon:yes gene_type:complete
MINVRKLIHSKVGQYIISILLGLGLATLFRKVCKKRSCLVFKGAPLRKIKNQIFKYKNKCYKFTPEITKCSGKYKTVYFA